ncbi:MAG TPA: nitrilase-related carbon-nitrogen hydrolase [Fibrobacteria bacterium]|nr:nitrilase-related carbon-nitrogen hydrolase [Fibrobacteria bacterium]
MGMDIHLVQMAVARGKPGLNRAKVQSLTASLRPAKPSLIVLPELFSTGFLDEAMLQADPAGLAATAAEDRAFAASLARRLGSWVAGATVEAGPPGLDGNAGFRNLSLLYAPDGTERAMYRKVHPFSYGGEDRMFSRGNEIVTVDAEGWVIQPSICYDLRFPELYRAGSRRGAHLILVQANWPQARQAHWEVLLRARAIENQAFVAGVNCTGAQESLRFAGGSAILTPKGETLAAGGDEEGVVRGKADLDECRQWRKHFPALRDRMAWDFFDP